MNNQLIEIIGFGLDDLIGLLIKIVLVLICIVAILMLRQVGLMAKMVSIPVNGWFKGLALGFVLICLLLTAIVIVV